MFLSAGILGEQQSVDYVSYSASCKITARHAQSYEETMLTNLTVDISPGIFGVPLAESIRYANVAISLTNEQGESFIYGYVPIVVAKCGVFLKEKGESARTLRCMP